MLLAGLPTNLVWIRRPNHANDLASRPTTKIVVLSSQRPTCDHDICLLPGGFHLPAGANNNAGFHYWSHSGEAGWQRAIQRYRGRCIHSRGLVRPSCGGFANVPACMEALIANFKPLTQGALSYGYQQPSAEQVYDPLFPQWLCGVNLPSGLVTMGCFRLHLSASVS